MSREDWEAQAGKFYLFYLRFYLLSCFCVCLLLVRCIEGRAKTSSLHAVNVIHTDEKYLSFHQDKHFINFFFF